MLCKHAENVFPTNNKMRDSGPPPVPTQNEIKARLHYALELGNIFQTSYQPPLYVKRLPQEVEHKIVRKA